MKTSQELLVWTSVLECVLGQEYINVEARLVNGAIGLVTGFENRKSDSGIHICSISVKFENVADSVKIERQSSTFKVCQTTAEATRTRRKSHRRTIAVVTN